MLLNRKKIQQFRRIAEEAGEIFTAYFCNFSKLERAEEILITFPKVKKVSISEDGTIYIGAEKYTYVSTLKGKHNFILVSQKGEVYQ